MTKLSTLCTNNDYCFESSAHEYGWGGKELCIQVFPPKNYMPAFSIVLLKRPNGDVEMEKPITAAYDTNGHPVMMDITSYSTWLKTAIKGKKMLSDLNLIPWDKEFDALYEGASAFWYA